MRADGRFGGHFVQGHVDATGVVEDIRPDGDSHWLTIAFDRGLSPYLIRKGSIAVDGISLTVAGLRRQRVRRDDHSVHVGEHGTVVAAGSGDRVNIECDMIGKYVARALELQQEDGRT